MKQRISTALMFMVLLTLLLTACDSQALDAKLDVVEDAVEQRLDVIEDTIEGEVRITPAPVPKEDLPERPQNTVSQEPESAALLTKEQAQAIALEYAGVSADDVTWLRVEYDADDGVPEYDVQFRYGRWEYEYEIHAETGALLSFDKDD